MKRVEIKISEKHFAKIKEKADQYGFTSMTDFILFCCLNSRINVDIGKNTESSQQEFAFYSKFFEDGKITEPEYIRIKSVIIEKLEKTSVKEP